MNSNFWRNKRVLITGHTGFKGSWLSLWLQSWGAEITGYALPPSSNPSLFHAANVGEGMTSIYGDIRDQLKLQEIFSRYQPEIIIHMAAQPLVRQSYREPVETYSTNVMGVVNLLEAVRQTGCVKSVVNVTSDKCYENREWVWGYREDEAMGGFDPYSSSKGCSELITAAYRNSYFNPSEYHMHGVAIGSARAGNVIGGGDWSDERLIPDILRAFVAGKPAEIRNPHAIRPWQHVLEPLTGYLRLAQTLYEKGPAFGGGWNFGPSENDARSVGWVMDGMIREWGGGASWKAADGHHPHEANYLKLDSSKSKALLQWGPTWSLQEALKMVCIWHKAYLSQADMRELTLKQIETFNDFRKMR